MILNKIFSYRRLIILGMLPLLLCLLVELPGFAQDSSSDEARSANVRWTTKSVVIVINYDLIGETDAQYEIHILMKRENDPSFTGNNREIRWYYRRDYPQGFQEEGYYFEIQVKTLAQSNTWLYYALGGAALTAGVIALIVSKNQTSSSSVLELPLPPGRP